MREDKKTNNVDKTQHRKPKIGNMNPSRDRR